MDALDTQPVVVLATPQERLHLKRGWDHQEKVPGVDF